jgi:hypothetical protein
LARAYATTGNRDEAALLIDELDRRPVQRSPFELARLHLLLNQSERAIFWLRRACEERAPSMAFFQRIASWAGFDSLRPDPRFGGIVECARQPAGSS